MILVLASQKGGVGKSTIAVNLAVAFRSMGLRPLLIDNDPQSTTARFVRDRFENARSHLQLDIKVMIGVLDYSTVKAYLNNFDIIIIDVAGADSAEMRSAVVLADVAIFPFRPSQADLDTLWHLQSEIVDKVIEINPSIQIFALLNFAPTNPRIREEAVAREILEDFPKIQVFQSTLSDRKVYRDSIAEAKGVVEMNDHKAIVEMKQLIEELYFLAGENHGYKTQTQPQ